MSDPISDGIVADSIAAEAREAGRQSRSRFAREADGTCSNCGTPLKGRVCHSCGQDADSFHRPIWSLFWEVLDGMLSIDGKLWRTLPKLMFQPGRLTRHYLSGVRARYVQPFRLFLVASVIFIAVFWRGFGDGTDVRSAQPIELDQDTIEALDELESRLEESNPAVAAELAEIQEQAAGADGALNQANEALRSPEALAMRREAAIREMRRYLVPEEFDASPTGPEGEDVSDLVEVPGLGRVQLSGFSEMPYSLRLVLANQLEVIIRDPSRWFDAMQESMTYLFIILLPVHALILAFGQIWRRGFYFYDHLVVSLHFHAFILLLLIILNLLGPLLNEWAILIFLLWSNFYVYRMHRIVYEHGRIMSVLRTLSLDFTYAIVLVIGMLGLMIVGVFTA
ncbi:DUF3667 domain-containing protein [Hyphobacterium sp. HN65]|uniref:DUF3667 domain-containing protein n=1 Tax=Hyphobacterium lacteum TaxID=3116575 RepID=A0ABU7LSY3_9PROT|nr:DUF3667 domain-containing protein [Hyphobacterium sp. HN65]MEE2527014.1 DUF3667 domain-containing protein [Hyphobacterium sp. HN65]